MAFWNSKSSTEKPGPTGISLEKRIGTARAVVLTKGLGAQKAAVYLVIDRSGSMSGYFRDDSVQNLAEQILGLAASFDDDGLVPVVYFDHGLRKTDTIKIGEHAGVINKHHCRMGTMGATDYSHAMACVVVHYTQHYPAQDVPAFVVFQTDGDTGNREGVLDIMKSSSSLPIFWQFVGFGQKGTLAFLEHLDSALRVPEDRAIDNASLFEVGRDPKQIDDVVLYQGLMEEFPGYLVKARAAGILRD